MRATVPANLLLLGEYAVLEEGGLGLAVAVEPRVRVRARAHPSGLEVIARMDVELRWRPGASSGDPRAAVLEAALEATLQAFRPEGMAAADGLLGSVEVDSSEFFLAGRKGGYGSSAAAAVALCWALLALAGYAQPEPSAVLEAALAAHRRAQGGRGSGYDVLASFHGGVGLFAGGRSPSWQPLRLPWLEPLYLFSGERSLSTPGAIGRYREWQSGHPGEARRFLEESNRCVQGFARSSSRREALEHLRSCRELGLRLGQAIGVPAELVPPGPEGPRPEDCKALGAGNELGLAFPESLPALVQPAGALRRAHLALTGLAPEGAEGSD